MSRLSLLTADAGQGRRTFIALAMSNDEAETRFPQGVIEDGGRGGAELDGLLCGARRPSCVRSCVQNGFWNEE